MLIVYFKVCTALFKKQSLHHDTVLFTKQYVFFFKV